MVPGKHVRPTSDRVKESLFNVLGPYFDGGKVLDLFAGTGNLGLEALSRGMEQAVFVDSSYQSIQTVQQNIKKTHLFPQSIVWKKDAKRAVADCADRGWVFDLIFIDPPYHLDLYLPILNEIEKSKLLAEEGLIVAEHAKEVVLPDEVGSLYAIRDLSYGETHIRLYELVEQGDQLNESSSLSR